MESPIELAPDYYLENFFKLTHHAVTWYSDLLTEEEHTWLCSFDSLSKHAQCLLVRLYSRKGCWFRSDKLNYQEIPFIDAALAELGEQDFISLSPPLSHQELAANLLTKPEISALYPELPKSLKKDALVERLSNTEFDRVEQLEFTIVRLNSAHMIDVLLTLFFANTHQDLSQFVLDDLGLHQFEQYQLSKVRRFFNSREQIDRLIELSQLANLYWQFDRKDKANLDLLVEAMPHPVHHPYVDRKREHMLNDIARDYERIDELETALSLFGQTQLTPSRERRARIYDKLNHDDLFSDIVTEMLHSPIDVSELEVAQKLEQRLKRKQGEKVPRVTKPTCMEYRVELDLSQQRVELASKAHFESLGWSVFYAENALLNALLGLTFWDAIFAPIEGAFINAYQHRPLDLYHSDFVAKRQALIDEAFTQLELGNTQAILAKYDEKFGISNPFVQWSLIGKELLEQSLNTIPTRTLLELFKVQLSDLKLYRNGMPDLIAFRDNEFEWIEVKGPGDKLQDNQWRWIKEFSRLNVPFAVCYVTARKEDEKRVD
ncbi:VRR-NUC domain-containing protein [Vibrio parahaemolyticus]|uniref:VRR-NUC domain-containing protein n=1 Tax=Vibrio parahaemolyticus TaxID=670 RepID=UPI001C4F7B1E|nr:VRR-NUC domain-containing protein [Vibrio parahaemolyticus]MDL2012724.1 VRR-NUC domain-containing protein [Vibrio parahaemolyticus]HCG6788079.1 VRR-NUC domain-containing protein [Vibrio parahaemolyticus]HCH3848678.1 VRR-NUC domain-containing protein [Vibrio parahaemolyticus]HCM1414063.1 VRR-NUC domain-containing protein [Vibrio parahaemolyticus]